MKAVALILLAALPCVGWADPLFSLFAAPPGKMALGYGQGLVSEVKPATVQDFDRTRVYWLEAETDTLLSLHFGLRFAYDDSANITFADAGLTRGELYLSTAKLGLKVNIPLGFLRPYLGGGVMGGFLAVSNPENRKTHGFGAPWGRETSGIRAIYLHGGFDLMFTSEFGLRFAYERNMIETNRYGNLANTGVDFTHDTIMAGLVFAGK